MTKKSTSKEPFLPLFFGDFLGATAEWDGEERGLYVLLLGYQWTLGSLPAEPRKLRKLVDYDQENFERWWPTVSTKFEVDGDRLRNVRLEQHRAKTNELSAKNAESGRKGAEAKWRKRDELMAGASHGSQSANGDRQAFASPVSGERHEIAGSEQHGAPNSNPSHPIPSHADSTVVAEPNTPGAMAGTLRRAGVKVTSINPTLLGWVKDKYTTAQIMEVVELVRKQPGKEDELLAPNYIDKILRDPGRQPQYGTGNLLPLRPGTLVTHEQRETRDLQALMSRRASIGLADFRDPQPRESASDYRQAQDAEWNKRKAGNVTTVQSLAAAAAAAMKTPQ